MGQLFIFLDDEDREHILALLHTDKTERSERIENTIRQQTGVINMNQELKQEDIQEVHLLEYLEHVHIWVNDSAISVLDKLAERKTTDNFMLWTIKGVIFQKEL